MTSIDLRRESDYRRESYGVLLTSRTRHRVTGRGVHNPHHDHVVDVWENKMRDDYEGQAEAYKDPRGGFTERPYSFLLSPQASVIALNPIDDGLTQGDDLELGGIVRLTIEGFPIGWFQIMTERLQNPHLVPVDVETSASRQFYIDSGEYLERSLEA